MQKGDLFQIYKIINKIEVVDIDINMGIGNNHRTVCGGGQTRRNGYQIKKRITGKLSYME